MPRERIDDRRMRRTPRIRGDRRRARSSDGRTLKETLRDQTDELLRVLEEIRLAEWRRELEKMRSASSGAAGIDESGLGRTGL